jgi:2,5-diamino-6-(ribosylamino)-4(3H)-pyrimidinone 5'-phosphate reductase
VNKILEVNYMLPRVVIHNAVSVDGRTDWFTANIEKFYDLTSKWEEDATLAGSDTLLAAYAEATTAPEDAVKFEKDPTDTRPLLIVPDSQGKLRIWHLLRQEPYWRDVLVLCSHKTPQEYLEYLHKGKIDYLISGDNKVDFKAALEEINTRYKVNYIRVDSGGKLNGVLLREGLVDEVSLLIHPYLVGGLTPRSMFQAPDLDSAEKVIKLKPIKIEMVEGELIWIRYEVIREN